MRMATWVPTYCRFYGYNSTALNPICTANHVWGIDIPRRDMAFLEERHRAVAGGDRIIGP